MEPETLTILKWGPFGPATQRKKNKQAPVSGRREAPLPPGAAEAAALSRARVPASPAAPRKATPRSARGSGGNAGRRRLGRHHSPPRPPRTPNASPHPPRAAGKGANRGRGSGEAPRPQQPRLPSPVPPPIPLRRSSRGPAPVPQPPALAGTQTHPKMTAFQTIMLFSDGAPLTPAGGSSCNLQKHTAAPLSAATRRRPPITTPRAARLRDPPCAPAGSPLAAFSLTAGGRGGYLLKSLMRRRRAGVDISLAGSELGHKPGSALPEEAEGAEAAEGAPRGTALPLRSRGSVWRRLSTTPE